MLSLDESIVGNVGCEEWLILGGVGALGDLTKSSSESVLTIFSRNVAAIPWDLCSLVGRHRNKYMFIKCNIFISSMLKSHLSFHISFAFLLPKLKSLVKPFIKWIIDLLFHLLFPFWTFKFFWHPYNSFKDKTTHLFDNCVQKPLRQDWHVAIKSSIWFKGEFSVF